MHRIDTPEEACEEMIRWFEWREVDGIYSVNWSGVDFDVLSNSPVTLVLGDLFDVQLAMTALGWLEPRDGYLVDHGGPLGNDALDSFGKHLSLGERARCSGIVAGLQIHTFLNMYPLVDSAVAVRLAERKIPLATAREIVAHGIDDSLVDSLFGKISHGI